MGLHLAIVSPLDATRLARELSLSPTDSSVVPAGHGGHSVTEVVLAIRGEVDSLDLVTLDPQLDRPVVLTGAGVRLAVGPFRPRARTRSLDLFAHERNFIADQLRQSRPDVVSAHWTYEYALGALDSGAPTLVTVRDWAPTVLRYQRDPYRAVRLLMQRLTFRRGSDFAAVSPYIAGRVERCFDGPVSVIPNAVGTDWFAEPVEPRGRCDAIAINNGFGDLKNVHTLLRAWPRVRAELPHATLSLVGEGYEPEGQAAEWASRNRLGQNVAFLGPLDREEIATRLRRSSVFVHPSREESFGMTVLEAMATATPVVGGRLSGAVPWLIADGAGVPCDVRSPKEIADTVLAILHDPVGASAMGQRGRLRAVRDFAAGSVASAYLERLARVGAST
jgi:L-malate glycosyltransferase